MKRSQLSVLSSRVSIVRPEAILPVIHQGEVTYVEFEEFIYFHYTFIKVLEMLKARGKPLVVHIRSIDNDIFSLQSVIESLSQFDAVDYVIEDKKGDFSLLHREEAFFSNTFFFGKDINAYSEELIDRRRSYYHTPLRRVSLSFSKFLNPDKLIQTIESYQKEGKNVSLVTGVFDVVHPGHITFLEKAKKSADVLIVLVNSDLSASHQPKNRRHDRPIHRLHERVGVLNALGIIGHIVPFDSKNALPLLENLPSNIVYVKTRQDKERKSILKEADLVKQRGGKIIFIPNLRNKSGSIISSTMLINACREKVEKQQVIFDEGWSSGAREILQRLLQEIQEWDKKTSQLTQLKERLRERYDGSLITALVTEQEVVEEVGVLAQKIVENMTDKRDYHTYVIPYLIGKMLDFPFRIVPVQYKKKGLPYGMINATKRLGGKTVFIDTAQKFIYKPIRFESYFWKKMPHHTLYEARQKKRSFFERIYVYSQSIHFRTLSVKLLLEEYVVDKHSSKSKDLYHEIEHLMGKMWEDFEEMPFDPGKYRHIVAASDHNPVSYFPGVVAHGGAAVLSPKDPRAENSASGIRHALRKGVDIVEIDICVCKDGWMVSHDRFLEVGTTAKGLITDKTEEELKKIPIRLTSGEASTEKMITVTDALEIVAQERTGDPRDIYVKIDIKLSQEALEKKLIDTILNSGIPVEKVLVTSQLVDTNRRLQALCPKLPMEFNTVETNLYLLAYQLMQDELMLALYLDYVIYFARKYNAHTVSLAQFTIPHWGEELVRRFIASLHKANFYVQVWVASTLEEYIQDANLRADYVLMQDPFLISKAIRLRRSQKLARKA